MPVEPRMALSEPVADRLACPRCGGRLRADPDGVGCDAGHRFPWRSGYLDFSGSGPEPGSTAQTFLSFGYEWNTFDDVRDEDEAFGGIYFADLDVESLRGKVGLDAGCGKGRYTRILARHLDEMVALDGSLAAEAAARNLGDLGNVTVVRSDLRRAPFAPQSFDFISSLGVLHHLDDPRQGFSRLLELLAPGGQVLLYLYSRPEGRSLRGWALAAATALRTVTVRMPHRLLRACSVPIAGLLWAGTVLPGRWGERRGIPALASLPMDTYRDKPFRSLVLDTFDRLSAPVEHRYVWSELAPWFEESGLVVDAARDRAGWFVLAHRP